MKDQPCSAEYAWRPIKQIRIGSALLYSRIMLQDWTCAGNPFVKLYAICILQYCPGPLTPPRPRRRSPLPRLPGLLHPARNLFFCHAMSSHVIACHLAPQFAGPHPSPRLELGWVMASCATPWTNPVRRCTRFLHP